MNLDEETVGKFDRQTITSRFRKLRITRDICHLKIYELVLRNEKKNLVKYQYNVHSVLKISRQYIFTFGFKI